MPILTKVSISCENLGQYTPFNDTDQPRTEQFRIAKLVAKDGIDTSAYDPYRQGVEIRNNRQRFLGMLPKMWAGNLCHAIQPSAIGQARSFVEFNNSVTFEEKPTYNPVAYLTDPNYPLPIIFNEGPQQEEVASMEPFIIPFRKHDTYSNYFPRGPHGTVELGGNTHDMGNGRFGTEKLEQFQDYAIPTISNPYLEEGEYFFGNVLIEGFTDPDQRAIEPFDDTSFDRFIQQIRTSQPDFIEVLKMKRLNLDEDLRQVYGRRSASAGYSVYGPNMASYGTDSIAYGNMARGS